jgi:hypothetical protein
MKEYLPAGSVVRLAGAERNLIIVGIIQASEDDPDTVHDYLGFPYPQGYMGPNNNYLFDETDIEEVVFRGYEDEDHEKLMQFVDLAQSLIAENSASHA